MKQALFVLGTVGNVWVSQSMPQMNFRRDNYLDQKLYPEGNWAPIPMEGGRIQFISDVAKNLTLSYPLTVDLGSAKLTMDASIYPDHVPSDGLDWVHSYYNGISGTLFTSFHMHTDDMIKSIDKLTVTDAKDNVIIDDKDAFNVNMESAKIQVTYVTTRNDFAELVVHFHNYGDSSHTIDSISVNSGFYEFDGFKLKAGEHAVKVFDVTKLNFQEVSVWSAVVSWDGKSAGYGGRLIKELFPIEDWPKSAQCPFPVDGAEQDNFEILKDELHINTHFLGGRCDADEDDIYDAAVESNGEWYVLPSWDHFEDNEVPSGAYDGIAAAFLGDESDSSVENSWEVWSRAQIAQDNYERHATYDGGHSNHLNGLYSGVSDIQGMDFYVAGCAPHITTWGSTMRIQGAYDYLYNARQNHKPLTTWLYSQGWCSDCWSVDNLDSGELLVQLGSVVAAGGKGLMLFQSDLELKDENSWKNGGKFLNSVKLISEFLRTADPEGAIYSTSAKNAITQVLYGPSGLLFIALSTDASGYNDKTCGVSGSHWTFNEQTIDETEINIPSDLINAADGSVSEHYKVVEVENGKYISDPSDVTLSIDDGSNTWKIKSMKLGTSSTTVRMFMMIPK